MSYWPNKVAIGDFVGDLDGTDGEFRVVAKVTGWDDAAPVRSRIEERAQQDGGFDSPGLYGPRVIGVDGVVEAPTPAGAQAVCDALNALTPRTVHEFIVDKESVGSRSALTRVTQGAVVEWFDDLAFSYSVQVTAPDHLKYGLPVLDQASLAGTVAGAGLQWPLSWPLDWGVPAGETPGSLFLPNAGTATYWPVLRIDGPVTNPMVQVAETGDWIRFGDTIPAGQFLEIDCKERHAMFGANSDDVRNLIDSSGAWLGAPPGGATLTYTADSADAAAVLTAFGFEGAWT